VKGTQNNMNSSQAEGWMKGEATKRKMFDESWGKGEKHGSKKE